MRSHAGPVIGGSHPRKTSVEIDEELLVAVQRVLSTATLKDTIEEAFREVLRAQARRDEVEALSTMRGMDLMDQEVMSEAWHSCVERRSV